MNKEYFDTQTKQVINYATHLLHVSLNEQLSNEMTAGVLNTLLVWQSLVLAQMANDSDSEVNRAIKKLKRELKNRGYLYAYQLAADLFDDQHASNKVLDIELQRNLAYLTKQGLQNKAVLSKTIMRLYMWLWMEGWIVTKLTRKDLKKLGIVNDVRDQLVVKTAAVPVAKNSKTNAYEYELSALLRSVVFRLVFIKNYQQIEQLDLEDHQFKLTAEMKQLLKSFRFEDQYWFGQIKALNAPAVDQRDWEALAADLKEVRQALKQYKQQSSKLDSQLRNFKVLYADLIKLVNEANEDGLKADAVQFNNQFDQNRFTHSLMAAYNRRLNWLFEDLGKFNLADEDSNDLSDTDAVLPSLATVEIGLTALDSAIASHQADDVFNLTGSPRIVERITKYLQKVIDNDQFEEHYQKLVDPSFNLDDLYLGSIDNDRLSHLIDGDAKVFEALLAGDDQAVTNVEKKSDDEQLANDVIDNSVKRADHDQLASAFNGYQPEKKSDGESINLPNSDNGLADDDDVDNDILGFLHKKGEHKSDEWWS